MSQQRSPRSGTIPVPLVPQREVPWFKISVAANVILALGLIGSLFLRSGSAGNGRDQIAALAEKDRDEALAQGAAKLNEADEATRYWHEFLGKEYLKAGKKDQAKTHYAWLTKNFPKDNNYRQGLASATAKGGGKKPPKKK